MGLGSDDKKENPLPVAAVVVVGGGSSFSFSVLVVVKNENPLDGGSALFVVDVDGCKNEKLLLLAVVVSFSSFFVVVSLLLSFISNPPNILPHSNIYIVLSDYSNVWFVGKKNGSHKNDRSKPTNLSSPTLTILIRTYVSLYMMNLRTYVHMSFFHCMILFEARQKFRKIDETDNLVNNIVRMYRTVLIPIPHGTYVFGHFSSVYDPK